MKIFLLANNKVGLEVAEYLIARGENIVGLSIHPPEKQRFAAEIIATCNLPKEFIFQATDLRDPKILEEIRGLKPDIAIAAFWGYILKSEFCNIMPKGCINFHPGFLPYNRGKNPDVWPIIEGTPAGVTIHYVDEGIDTGDIIGQRKVLVEPIDTAGMVYEKTLKEIVDLFKEIWPSIKAGTNSRTSQDSSKATTHKEKDIAALDRIELNRRYTGLELLNRLKARSHPNRAFAYFEDKEGKRVYVKIRLSYNNEF